MTIAEKLQTIADNEQRVYDAGYNAGIAENGGVTITIDNTMDASVNIYFYRYDDNSIDTYSLDAHQSTSFDVPSGSMIAVECASTCFGGHATTGGNEPNFVHPDEHWNLIACDRTKTVTLYEI